jgi:hypothetical protein
MRPLGKSAALGAAFSAGIVIAANADPLYRGGAGSSQPPRPQTATLPPANARAPGSGTRQYEPLGPAPRQSSSGRDGSYAGWMTELGKRAIPQQRCVLIPRIGQHEDRAGQCDDLV